MYETSQEQQLQHLRNELISIENRRKEILLKISHLEADIDNYNFSDIESIHKNQLVTKSINITVNNQSPPTEKIKLFRSLFRGREDVYPRHFKSKKTGKPGYSPVCKNEWQSGKCEKPYKKCTDCTFREYLPVTDQIISWHLSGHKNGESANKDFTIGVYPILPDETCYFLAVDFDKESWIEDIQAFQEICNEMNIPVSIERSRSGNGAHAWFFFTNLLPCSTARKLGTYLLTETMQRRPEIGLKSYDRLFPNQDTLPTGGFGNLIALPLQKKPRNNDNSIFLDENLTPYADQWDYLSAIKKIEVTTVEEIVHKAISDNKITGLRLPVTDETVDRPWETPPSRNKTIQITTSLPKTVNIVSANQIFIKKETLTPALLNGLIRIAAFQNPEFYKMQSIHKSVWKIPRIISCAENFPKHIALPRGCLDEVTELLENLGITPTIKDERFKGNPLKVKFNGELYPEQRKSAKIMLKHDSGILAATTAFGKTIVAISMLSEREVNTLILVHRTQLQQQWKARLEQFLDIDPDQI